MPSALIETGALHALLGRPHLKLLDASWHLPGTVGNAAEEYRARHIPGAIFFDIEAIRDYETPLPHMLPKPDDFARSVERLGIASTDRVVVYDNSGMFSAPRAWWMFRVMGHENIQVLSGGLPKWQRENKPVDDKVAAFSVGVFEANFQSCCMTDKKAILTRTSGMILDARSEKRFAGHQEEPRAGVRSGHIPDSINMPYQSLLDEQGRFKSNDILRQVFSAHGVDGSQPVIATCGSGITACILALACHELGWPDIAVYDGSWAEWGADFSLPIETD